jgi:hypothetical protein
MTNHCHLPKCHAHCQVLKHCRRGGGRGADCIAGLSAILALMFGLPSVTFAAEPFVAPQPIMATHYVLVTNVIVITNYVVTTNIVIGTQVSAPGRTNFALPVVGGPPPKNGFK